MTRAKKQEPQRHTSAQIVRLLVEAGCDTKAIATRIVAAMRKTNRTHPHRFSAAELRRWSAWARGKNNMSNARLRRDWLGQRNGTKR